MPPSRSGFTLSGFTLLEVLIALVIAALAMVALLRAGSAGLTATDAASRYQEALSRARSHLDAATHGTLLRPADNQGDDGRGFHWRVRIAAIGTENVQQPGPARRPPVPVTLYAVMVRISWGQGSGTRSVQLDTRQVGTPPS